MTDGTGPKEGSGGPADGSLVFDEYKSAGAGIGTPREVTGDEPPRNRPIDQLPAGTPREPRDYSEVRKWVYRTCMTAIAGGILGAIGVGYSAFIDSLGERVFNDEIDGAKVSYFEGITKGWKAMPFSTMNEMRVSKKVGEQDITYVFRDTINKNPINHRLTAEQKFGEDFLEYCEITDSSGSHSYNSSGRGDKTLEGVHIDRVIKSSTTMYNDLRTKVRNELIRRDREGMSKIENLVGFKEKEEKK